MTSFSILLLVLIASPVTVQARPKGRSDDVTSSHRTPTRRSTSAAPVQTSPQPSSDSVAAADGWQSGGWTPNQPGADEPSEPVSHDEPDSQLGLSDDGTTAGADGTSLDLDDANAILNLNVDVSDIAAGETDPLHPSTRSARRISGFPISEDEAEREERRKRARFVQDTHGSNVLTSVSTDFQNGTFVGDLYGTENPWLQKYAPFYYPQNPLPTQLNHQPDGPPPVRLRQVHIGDTVLVPPKVKYSDQVLRTIHDAKLRSLPKLREEVHPDIEEEEEEYQEEAFEEVDGYHEQHEVEEEEYGPESSQEAHKPPQHYSSGEVDEDPADYEWRPNKAPETGKPQSSGQQAQPVYNTTPVPNSKGSGLSSRPGPPYQTLRPPPGFPFKQQSSAISTQRPGYQQRPQAHSSPVPHNSKRSPTKPSPAPKSEPGYTRNLGKPSPAPKPAVGYNQKPIKTNPVPKPVIRYNGNPVKPSPSPKPSQHNNQHGSTKPKAVPNPIPKYNSQPKPTRSAPAQPIGGGLFSPIRSQPRTTARPTLKRIQARPVFHPPPTSSRQKTAVPSRVRTFSPSPKPSSIRTVRPRYRTTPRPTARPDILEENGYSNRVKPDDVIPFSLSYGYEVVAPTTTTAPPPLSQYGKPKASTILGGLKAGPNAEVRDEVKTLDGPVAPLISTRPLAPISAAGLDNSDGFGAPKPSHIVGGEFPPPIDGRASPVPPQPAREGYTRPKDNESLPPPPAAPRREGSSERVTTSIGRPGYSAPRDADIINGDERLTGIKSQPLHTLNLVNDQDNTPDVEDTREGTYEVEEVTRGGYMMPKEDDILSDDQAAGFVRSRYFPQSATTSNDRADTGIVTGFGSPKEENLVGNSPVQVFETRTRPIQFETTPKVSGTVAQNGYSKPKNADIVGFSPNTLLEGESVPRDPSKATLSIDSPQKKGGFSPPRPQGLVDYSENSILNVEKLSSASESPQPTRSILDFGPKGYSKPKDTDVLNAENSHSPNELQSSPIKFQPVVSVPQGGANAGDSSPNGPEHSEPWVSGTASPQSEISDAINSRDTSAPSTESSGETRPLIINQPPVSAVYEVGELNTAPDASEFGPLRSDTVLQSDTNVAEAPALSSADKQSFGPPRPQYIVSETGSAGEQDPDTAYPAVESGGGRPQDSRGPSDDLYTVDDFLRSEEVSILGAFRAPDSSSEAGIKADRIDVTTQRTRAAPRPASSVGSGWHRRADPGPFRAQAALLDAQFAGLFVDELPTPRRRQQTRRPAVRRRPEAPRRRPVAPEFGPPFAILESRADHGWPAAEDDRTGGALDEEQQESTAVKFGSAFAAERLTPPSRPTRRRPAVAPPRSRTRQRPTEAPRGGLREQVSPFGAEFAAPFAVPAASQLSVTAVRPGPNPIRDWPKITDHW